MPKEVTSSATAVATQLAGPPPTLPNGYVEKLSYTQWTQVKDAVTSYVQYVEVIIVGLCGAHGAGGTPGAPWYGGMGSGPSGGNNGPAPTTYPDAPVYGGTPIVGGGLPANTCACK